MEFFWSAFQDTAQNIRTMPPVGFVGFFLNISGDIVFILTIYGTNHGEAICSVCQTPVAD